MYYKYYSFNCDAEISMQFILEIYFLVWQTCKNLINIWFALRNHLKCVLRKSFAFKKYFLVFQGN